MDHWYFAYGSNLWFEQMVQRTGIEPATAEPRRVRLPVYRLAFNMQGEDDRVYANIIPATASAQVETSEPQADSVLGVVYRCSEDVLAKLDIYESGYDRGVVVVNFADDPSGEQLAAVAYVAKPGHVAPEGRPSDEYLRRILVGAREQNLPDDYLRRIERLAGR